jgi:hypothetical protein
MILKNPINGNPILEQHSHWIILMNVWSKILASEYFDNNEIQNQYLKKL